MSFIWPRMLGALVLTPALVYGYIRLQRRRAMRAAELAAQGFVPARRLGRKRHVPFILFLTAITLMIASLARPQMKVGIPKREGTVILAFDVSNSMLADDLKPTRMDAAKAAAKLFVERQPDTIKIGVVTFTENGFVNQPPTDQRVDVLAAIERLKPDGGTSLGQGIYTALTAITGKAIVADPAVLNGDLSTVDIGHYSSAAIVMLSDGENTADPDPIQLSELASLANVRIFPIGLGGAEGAVVELDGFSAATTLDEETLTKIAKVTGGTYFRAEDEVGLADIYKKIDLKFTTEAKQTEVTAFLTGLGSLLLLIGGALSLIWFARVV